ncbi:hypothetical protein [Ruminococcus sp.]|uniref:hypothetical protein n=1 Tax=Ruminococcus sp. TaxID=41978 RepID=UPI003EFD7F92
MNDTSTKVFIALYGVASAVFADCYINKQQPTITLNELLQKKAQYWICCSEVTKERLEALNDIDVKVGEFQYEYTQISIEANQFKCSFHVCDVFYLLAKFAKLAREEKILGNARIKYMCKFTKIFVKPEQTKQDEPKVEQAKPVVITIKVEQPKQKPQVINNPYGGDYAALLAARINQMINVPF